ncbi:MAG: nuclear transport factor 2 family protein [Acidobacteriaceae bacterium]|jgi:ketosteroid isomerase-like protein
MRLRNALLRVIFCFAFSLRAPSALLAQASPSLPGTPNSPAQTSRSVDPLVAPSSANSLLAQPTLNPGALFLMDLERRFAADVATGGGKAFASWFAADAVSLSNGKPAILGRGAIATAADWDPKTYQLTWTPAGAQMGPSNDMGFTWGHYEGRSRDARGEPVLVTGRYMTVWRKLPDGTWKVALDASATEPPATGDCCALPKP